MGRWLGGVQPTRRRGRLGSRGLAEDWLTPAPPPPSRREGAPRHLPTTWGGDRNLRRTADPPSSPAGRPVPAAGPGRRVGAGGRWGGPRAGPVRGGAAPAWADPPAV